MAADAPAVRALFIAVNRSLAPAHLRDAFEDYIVGSLASFREIVHRAALDGREASLLRAMGIEVIRYLERAGVPVARPPVADPS